LAFKIISIERFILPDKTESFGGPARFACAIAELEFFAGGETQHDDRKLLTTYGRKQEMDHQMFLDLGLKWRAYDGGARDEAKQ